MNEEYPFQVNIFDYNYIYATMNNNNPSVIKYNLY